MPSHLLKLRRNDRRLIDALLHPRMNIVRQAFQNRATWCLGSLRQRSKIQRCKTACACLQGIVFLPLSTRNTNIVKSWVTWCLLTMFSSLMKRGSFQSSLSWINMLLRSLSVGGFQSLKTVLFLSKAFASTYLRASYFTTKNGQNECFKT